MPANPTHKAARRSGKPRKPSQVKAEASLAKRRKAAGMRLLSPVWLDADVVKIIATAKTEGITNVPNLGNMRQIVNDAIRFYLG